MPYNIAITDAEVVVIVRRVLGVLTVDATVALVASDGRHFEDDALTPSLSAAQRTAANTLLDNIITQAKARRSI
jgi:hypothetical protein